MATLDQDDLTAIETIIKRMMGVISEPQQMGSISSCIPSNLCGAELRAFMKAREKEIRLRGKRK